MVEWGREVQGKDSHMSVSRASYFSVLKSKVLKGEG